MKFYSTNNKSIRESFRNAVMKGLADDGGLYMPESIPEFNESFLSDLNNFSITQIAFEFLANYTSEDLSEEELSDIVNNAFTFEAPVHKLSDELGILELFHGPTLAFKDFGARFMARTMGHFAKDLDKELNILVATSGDTGSAVASGFYGVEGVNVFILYPSGKVSDNQEKQLTTYGKNIIALEIDGTFDDCQKIVKEAFLDQELKSKLYLSSANSINVARFLPQAVYYIDAYKQVKDLNKDVVFSVPSGNLGNITAGLIAKKMGLPISKFVAATNSNDVFTEYINTGNFSPRASVPTISNAMDVGNPSNLARIIDLYDEDVDVVRVDINSSNYDDQVTRETINKIYNKYNYVIDPHGAVGYLAIEKFRSETSHDNSFGIVLETAHPSKFKDVVESELNIEIKIPERLAKCLDKEKHSVELSNKFEDIKNYLINL